MSEAQFQLLADRLFEAERTGTPCAPVRSQMRSGDVAAAYAVQEINVARRVKAGGRVVGRKIGLTSKAVQAQLGVGQPDFGALFADMEIASGEEIPVNRLIQPKIEAEIAFVLERDLPEEAIGLAEIAAAIGFAVPALEIVDSRIAAWDISILDTIADNASSGLFVLGRTPRKLDALDLRLCGMVLESGGVQLSVGAGAACLGHPLDALLWLAKTMARLETPLRGGDVILSGALGPMAPAQTGKAYRARIEGLGDVAVSFAGRLNA